MPPVIVRVFHDVGEPGATPRSSLTTTLQVIDLDADRFDPIALGENRLFGLVDLVLGFGLPAGAHAAHELRDVGVTLHCPHLAGSVADGLDAHSQFGRDMGE